MIFLSRWPIEMRKSSIWCVATREVVFMWGCVCVCVCVYVCENIWHLAWHWVGLLNLNHVNTGFKLKGSKLFFILLVTPVNVCSVMPSSWEWHFPVSFSLFSCVGVGQRDLICMRSRRLPLGMGQSFLSKAPRFSMNRCRLDPAVPACPCCLPSS